MIPKEYNNFHMCMTSEIRNSQYPFNWIIFAYKYSTGYNTDEEDYVKIIRNFESKDIDTAVKDFDNVLKCFKETDKSFINVDRDINIFVDVFKRKMTYTDVSKKYKIGSARASQIIRKVSYHLKYVKYRDMLLGVNTEIKENNVTDKFELILSELDVRTRNCIRRAGVFSIDDLMNLSFAELIHIRNMGVRSVDLLLSVINQYGIKLRKQNESDLHFIKKDRYIDDKYKEVIIKHFGSIDNI